MSLLEKKPSTGRGEPNVAALLTLFVPGLGHLYMGRVAFGVAAFLVVEGVFVLGYLLSGGLTFAFLDPELRGRFAILLTPEVGNLGGLLMQFRLEGFGPEQNGKPIPVPWPEHMRLGTTLTALSGLLNVCLMCQAHLHARVRREELQRTVSPAVQVACAWAVPGLGHLLQGRFLRGLLVFGLLFGLFLWGTELADYSNLSRERHFYYWAGQFLVGLPAIAFEHLVGDRPVTAPIEYADVGLLFGCVAGLLNVLAMLDVYGHAEARVRGELPAATASAEPRDAGAEAAPGEPAALAGQREERSPV